MRIDKDSISAVLLVWVLGLAAAFAILLFVPILWVRLVSVFLILWFCIFNTYFFRVPNRRRACDNRVVTSGADGEVAWVRKAYEPEFLKRNCMLVSVYMNFYDMHANFWPVDGTVTYYKYHPGKHMLAFKPKAHGIAIVGL